MKPSRQKARVERDETIEIAPGAISEAALDALAVEFGQLAATRRRDLMRASLAVDSGADTGSIDHVASAGHH